MRVKGIWFAGLALGLMIGLPQLAAQTKVAIIDFQQALLNTAEMQKRAAALEAKYRPRQQQLEELTRQLQELQAQLQSAEGEQAFQLQQEGARKQQEAQRISEDLQADVDFDREGILQSGAERMRAVVEQLREQRGFDLIIDVSTAISYSPALEITQAATEAYNAAYPN